MRPIQRLPEPITKVSCGRIVAPGGIGISPASCAADGSGAAAPSLLDGRMSTLLQAISMAVVHSKIRYFRMFMVLPVKASAPPGHPAALLAHPSAGDCSQLHVRRLERKIRLSKRPIVAMELDVRVQEAA